ncbi:VacJ family lipoprotein [Babesia caballi]|uniref:VacJ family lipoprotein n=1 Tax=Babesia caballi TaxID=5871 RepID=A0AAV4LXW7_BABCB|nr:VacJ family lipoprotein [Babesia caballi]
MRITNTIKPTKPLEEPDDKVQYGVADLMRCHVSGQNASAGKLSTIIIPNELLKPLGQLGNKGTISLSQSCYNLTDLLTKVAINVFNFVKKFLNLFGENYVTTSRQKGAHKSAKAAEVEAVCPTGQGGCPRVAEEGRGGGAGGLDVVSIIGGKEGSCDHVAAGEGVFGRWRCLSPSFLRKGFLKLVMGLRFYFLIGELFLKCRLQDFGNL